MDEAEKDTKAYLDRIRKTIADSERAVAQAALRIAETDRMLEKQGLTREQVMAMRFSEAQLDAVDAELKRRGMDPLERWGRGGNEGRDALEAQYDSRPAPENAFEPADSEFAERQRKFGMMMKPFHI